MNTADEQKLDLERNRDVYSTDASIQDQKKLSWAVLKLSSRIQERMEMKPQNQPHGILRPWMSLQGAWLPVCGSLGFKCGDILAYWWMLKGQGQKVHMASCVYSASPSGYSQWILWE